MPGTYTVTRPAEGRTLMHTTHLSCLPDADALASLYASGHVLLEDGRRTTAARRKELLALRAKALKGD